ncbi:XkdF-like putative serine protease domain-containing protein [Costertonia aggregata]|uniref:Phage-like element PBSX protein XkdF domain-containing protein n=1 Tax=Costertonia aggregata TaxID=343403 RepID=A0A7H9ARH1_9FLAO|nr:XkdF-like putative serine protease domain-containing protein [Costertonia aggregata]QLG46053.1 hypothetical protein HYG79_12090 [Costertonia aggregata]
MELYEVQFDPKKDTGIYGISVVSDPAMEGFFVALNKDGKPVPNEIQLSEVSKEQRILLGVVAIPDKPIYRNQDGKEFYITFPSETIKLGAHSFLKNQYNNNSSIEHEVKLSGVSVVESWIVEDTENDKSNIHGLKAPRGSWIVSMKVDNDELWNDYVKTGKVKGFSLDGLFSLNKLELKQKSMSDNNQSIVAEIKKGFAELKNIFSPKPETKVKLAQAKLADGETVVEFDGEEIEVGTQLFIVSEEGSIPAPDGQHELENGMLVSVTEGIVSEIMEKEVDEEIEASKDNQEWEALKEAFKILEAEMKTAKEGFESSLSEKDNEIAELKTQLSATPATEPKKHTSVELSTEQPKTSRERIKLALQQNK